MRNDITSSLALKRMCYILLRTWTEWWLNISPQHLKQEKGKSREKKGKRGSSQLVITKEKEHALFSVLWEEPPLLRTLSRTLFGIPQLETVDCETLHLFTSKTDKAWLRDLCRANCFASETQAIVWDFCTLGSMNLKLSYKDSIYVQMVCFGWS